MFGLNNASRWCRRAGFTLLEIMISVVIIALLVGAVYRFVEANLVAIRSSTELSEEKQAMTGLINFIQDQLNALPAGNPNILTGEPFKKNNIRGDRMEWVCRAGEGTLTTSGGDEYRVSLTIEPVDSKSDAMAIGVRRWLVGEDIKTSKFLPLLRGVVALQFKYFDKRQNQFREEWRYPDTKPWLVEVSVWRNADEDPYVALLSVPGANVQQ